MITNETRKELRKEFHGIVSEMGEINKKDILTELEDFSIGIYVYMVGQARGYNNSMPFPSRQFMPPNLEAQSSLKIVEEIEWLKDTLDNHNLTGGVSKYTSTLYLFRKDGDALKARINLDTLCPIQGMYPRQYYNCGFNSYPGFGLGNFLEALRDKILFKVLK